MKSFIDTEEIEGYLEETKNPSKEEVLAVIEKSLNKNRLNLRETAILINAESPELINLIKEGARTLKEKFTETALYFLLHYILEINVKTTVFIAVSGFRTKMQTEKL